MVKKPSVVTWYIIFAAVTLGLSLILTPSSSLLDLTGLDIQQYKTLSMVSNIAYFLAWSAAFYAYYSLYRYTGTLKKTNEGKSFANISKGTMILAWGLPISMIVSLILRTASKEYASLEPLRTSVNAFLPLLFSIVAFLFISIGSNALSRSTRKEHSTVVAYVMIYIFIVFGTVYTHFTLGHSLTGLKLYHMSSYPLMLTVIAPTLFSWFLGLVAAYALVNYFKHVKGLIYRRAIANVSAGICLVVLSDIFSHYIEGVFGARTYSASGNLFILIYLLILIQAGGFVLIARGANRLKRIEEV